MAENKWVTGAITLLIEVITPSITGRDRSKAKLWGVSPLHSQAAYFTHFPGPNSAHRPRMYITQVMRWSTTFDSSGAVILAMKQVWNAEQVKVWPLARSEGMRIWHALHQLSLTWRGTFQIVPALDTWPVFSWNWSSSKQCRLWLLSALLKGRYSSELTESPSLFTPTPFHKLFACNSTVPTQNQSIFSVASIPV